jgi:hypothetical protein
MFLCARVKRCCTLLGVGISIGLCSGTGSSAAVLFLSTNFALFPGIKSSDTHSVTATCIQTYPNTVRCIATSLTPCRHQMILSLNSEHFTVKHSAGWFLPRRRDVSFCSRNYNFISTLI